MQREILVTGDGSSTISLSGTGIMYHSIHGALTESRHVFIRHGFEYMIEKTKTPMSILEMGFGTGLNALLTCLLASRLERMIHYTSLENFPLEESLVSQLSYCSLIEEKHCEKIFSSLHSAAWNREVMISNWFYLKKVREDLRNFVAVEPFDLIYFDAFAPGAQPELWTEEIFRRLCLAMKPGAALLTYCSKGNVRRAMQAAGLTVEKLQGPPGKREMVRAVKV